jgi:copper chaperone CopZ
MKHVLVVFFVLLVSITNAQFKSANLQALGLTCAMCSNAITKSLKTIPFVEAVDVDLKNTSYNLKFKEGAAVDFDMIRKKVESAGFTVGSLKIIAEFKDVTVKNDALFVIGGQVFHFVGSKQQVLNGEQSFQIINKYFVSLKDAKKFQALSKSEVLKTEKAGPGGKALGVDATTRVFNVKI